MSSWAASMPSSCLSLRMAARFTPGASPDATSSGPSTSVGTWPNSGCEQHVLVLRYGTPKDTRQQPRMHEPLTHIHTQMYTYTPHLSCHPCHGHQCGFMCHNADIRRTHAHKRERGNGVNTTHSPHVWKCNFFFRTLLQQEPAFVVKEENRKRAVKLRSWSLRAQDV